MPGFGTWSKSIIFMVKTFAVQSLCPHTFRRPCALNKAYLVDTWKDLNSIEAKKVVTGIGPKRKIGKNWGVKNCLVEDLWNKEVTFYRSNSCSLQAKIMVLPASSCVAIKKEYTYQSYL